MKFFLSFTFLFLLSCSTPTTTQVPVIPKYSNDKICSQRALDKIAQHHKEKNDEPELDQKTLDELHASIKKAVPEAKECYRNELDGMFSDAEKSTVCIVIGTSKEGNLNFIDVENRSRPLSAKLKNCLVDAFSKVDVRKARHAIITQPINLLPMKKN